MHLIKRFCRDRRGATVIEYGLIIACLSLAIVAGVGTATNALQFLFSDTNSKLTRAFR